jgi:hypothetical protein
MYCTWSLSPSLLILLEASDLAIEAELKHRKDCFELFPDLAFCTSLLFPFPFCFSFSFFAGRMTCAVQRDVKALTVQYSRSDHS